MGFYITDFDASPIVKYLLFGMFIDVKVEVDDETETAKSKYKVTIIYYFLLQPEYTAVAKKT